MLKSNHESNWVVVAISYMIMSIKLNCKRKSTIKIFNLPFSRKPFLRRPRYKLCMDCLLEGNALPQKRWVLEEKRFLLKTYRYFGIAIKYSRSSCCY